MSAPAIGTPVGRWAGLGPYYAMFPVDFAFEVVREFCPVGGQVLDPFAGRGSSIYAAVAQKRGGVGIELSPVGWVFSKAKLHPAKEKSVLKRLGELQSLALETLEAMETNRESMPEFFRHCFAPRVLHFLQVARAELDWKSDRTDRTLMAIMLVYLHAKSGCGLSNQMRQSKSMSPPYAIQWWQERQMQPPEINAHEFLKSRIEWRYRTGLPCLEKASLHLADSTTHLDKVRRKVNSGKQPQFDLLFTSPPYFAVTNYQYDQWLRLWLLGNAPYPVAAAERSRGRFESKVAYEALMRTVFTDSALVLQRNATVFVRTDARTFTRQTTIALLREIFPRKTMVVHERPLAKQSQTALFGDFSPKPGEIDIVMK